MNPSSIESARMQWTPHVTVATVVEKEGKFLLVEELINQQIVLNQPAGHVEALETLVDAAIRETLEESGWTVKPVSVLGLYTYTPPCRSKTFYRTTFIAEAIAFDPDFQLDKDIIRTHWLSLDEIKSQHLRLRSPIVLKCVEDYCKGQQFPLSTLCEHIE